MDQSARDCRPLLLATAELMREMKRSISEPNQINQLRRSFFTFVRRHSLQEQGEADVFERIHRRQEVEELKNKPDLPAPELRKRFVIRAMQREAID
jgi:hypothetical protein